MAASLHSRVQPTKHNEPNPKHGKTQRSAGKRIWHQYAWDARGIIFIDYLKKGQTINSEYYMAFLARLNDVIKKKAAPFKEKKIAVSSRQCTGLQINQNDGNIA
jgi:hypothetical protein